MRIRIICLMMLLPICGLFGPAAAAQESQTGKNPSFRILTMPVVGIGTEGTLSFGARIGARWSESQNVYIQFKSAFSSQKTAFSCDGDGFVDGHAVKPWYTGEDSKGRWSVTAGYGYGFLPWLTAYAGLGYGQRALYWESFEGDWARVEPSSFSGAEMEAGVMASFGQFAVSAGVQTCMFKFTEINLGIGFLF